jgi:hypothetical protein
MGFSICTTEGKRITFTSAEQQKLPKWIGGDMSRAPPDDKPMPPELVDELSTLLADVLMAHMKRYPDLDAEPRGQAERDASAKPREDRDRLADGRGKSRKAGSRTATRTTKERVQKRACEQP